MAQALQQTSIRLWRFEGAELRDGELVQALADSVCCEFDIAPERRNELDLVLTEVITNSLDHGILGLDSTVKKDPKGFEQYFMARASRLAALTDGFIEISIDQHEPDAIRIVIQDSGEGFPYPKGALEHMPQSLLLAYGRGLLIIQKLCRSVTHIGNGNCVVLEFETH